jgi:hypothetical protein
MSITKPYKPLLVTTVGEPLPGTVLPEESYGLALEMDLTGEQFNENNINVFIQGERPFLLLVDRNTNLVDTRIIDISVLCLFSKNYIKIGGSPVIAFLHTEAISNEEQNSLFSEYLVSKLEVQGWPSIIQWHLSPVSFRQQLEQKRHVPLLVESAALESEYLEHAFLSDFMYASHYIFFKGKNFTDTLQLEQDYYARCSFILERNKVLQAGLQEYIAAKETANNLEVKTSMLEERLHNAEKTISVIRGKYKDDYDQLFKWYHNEYEILPLWYKRFGHILKVLMGKRTFKSLFHDHVKKYKT